MKHNEHLASLLKKQITELQTEIGSMKALNAEEKEKLVSELFNTKKQLENHERAYKALQLEHQLVAAENEKIRTEQNDLALELKRVVCL